MDSEKSFNPSKVTILFSTILLLSITAISIDVQSRNLEGEIIRIESDVTPHDTEVGSIDYYLTFSRSKTPIETFTPGTDKDNSFLQPIVYASVEIKENNTRLKFSGERFIQNESNIFEKKNITLDIIGLGNRNEEGCSKRLKGNTIYLNKTPEKDTESCLLDIRFSNIRKIEPYGRFEFYSDPEARELAIDYSLDSEYYSCNFDCASGGQYTQKELQSSFDGPSVRLVKSTDVKVDVINTYIFASRGPSYDSEKQVRLLLLSGLIGALSGIIIEMYLLSISRSRPDDLKEYIRKASRLISDKIQR